MKGIRLLKFRSWTPIQINKDQYPQIGFMFYWDLYEGGNNGECDGMHLKPYMKCTGILDKNGVEIYERDFLKYFPDNESRSEIYLVRQTHVFRKEFLDDTQTLKFNFEIVSNIYEKKVIKRHRKGTI